MEINQDHYFTDFEEGSLFVDEFSDTELVDNSKKSIKIMDSYDSKSTMKNDKNNKTEYLCMTMPVKDLEDFNGEQLLIEARNCTDKNMILIMMERLVGYISIFKKFYIHHIEDITDLKKEVESLREENNKMGEMIDKYIEKVDLEEAKLKKVDKEVANCKEKIEVHKKTINILTIKNQIYSSKEIIHQDEKRKWSNIRVATDKIIFEQQKTITQLKKNTGRAQLFTKKDMYLGIGCGIMVLSVIKYWNP